MACERLCVLMTRPMVVDSAKRGCSQHLTKYTESVIRDESAASSPLEHSSRPKTSPTVSRGFTGRTGGDSYGGEGYSLFGGREERRWGELAVEVSLSV